MRKLSLCLKFLTFPLGLLSSLDSQAAPPPVPTNVRAVVLPAEVLLTWDGSTEADHYRVYRGGPNRRWIYPAVTKQPRFRDTEFSELPSYYQIAAVSSSGEIAATAEFQVFTAAITVALVGVTVRPLSDTSMAIAWTMYPNAQGDALLEVGTNLLEMGIAITDPTLASRHEFAVANLLPDTTYFYRLTSAGANGGGITYWNTFVTRPYVEPAPTVVTLPPPQSPVLFTDEDVPVHFTLQGPLNYTVGNVPFGTMWGTPPNLVYLSTPEHSGWDIFEILGTDGVVTNSSFVIVEVRPVDDPPIAWDMSVELFEDSPRKFSLAANDLDSANLSFIVLSGPTNGVLRHHEWWLAPGEVQYEPNTNFFGIDHFTYAAWDGHSTGNVATVRLRVAAVNDRPFANNQTVTVPRIGSTNIALAMGDPDADLLTLTVLGAPQFGSVSGPTPNLSGQLLYTPRAGSTNNTDSFSYSVSDGTGGSATAVVNIVMTPTYFPPVANNITVTTESNEPMTVTLSVSTPNGLPIVWWSVTQPSHGTVNGTGSDVIYTPSLGFVGTDQFTFREADAVAFGTTGTVTINVVPPSPPAAPTGLTAAAVSKNQINLSWNDNSWNESGFRIERSPDNKGWKQIATVGPNIRQFSNIKLDPNKTYYYRVRAYNALGNSAYSNTTSAKTLK